MHYGPRREQASMVRQSNKGPTVEVGEIETEQLAEVTRRARGESNPGIGIVSE